MLGPALSSLFLTCDILLEAEISVIEPLGKLGPSKFSMLISNDKKLKKNNEFKRQDKVINSALN